jgi:hypothetical protein
LGNNAGSKFAKEIEDLKKFQSDLFTKNKDLTIGDVGNLEDLLVVYINKVKETYKGMAEEAQKASDVIQQNATGTQKNLEDQMKNVDEALEKFRTVGDERSKIQGMVELAAGVGQVSTALTTLTGL